MGWPTVRKSRKQFHSAVPTDPLGITYVKTRVIAGHKQDAPPHPGRVIRSLHGAVLTTDPVGITYVKTRVIPGHKRDDFPFPGRILRSLGRNPEVSAAVIGIQWRRYARGFQDEAPPHEGRVTRTLTQAEQAGEWQALRRYARGWQFPHEGGWRRSRLPGEILDVYRLQRRHDAIQGQRNDAPQVLMWGRAWHHRTPGIDIWIEQPRVVRSGDPRPLDGKGLFSGRAWRRPNFGEGEPRIVANLRAKRADSPGAEPGLGGKAWRHRLPGDGSAAVPLAPSRRIAAGFHWPWLGQAKRAAVPNSGLDAVEALPWRRIAAGEQLAFPGQTRRMRLPDGTAAVPSRRKVVASWWLPHAGSTRRAWIMAYQDRIQPRRLIRSDALAPIGGRVVRGKVIVQPPLLILRRIANGWIYGDLPESGRAWRSVILDVEDAPLLRRIAAGETWPWPGQTRRIWMPASAEMAADLIQQRRGLWQVLELPPEPGQSRRGLLIGEGATGADRLALRRVARDAWEVATALHQLGKVARSVAPGIPQGSLLLKADVWLMPVRDGIWSVDAREGTWDMGLHDSTWEIGMSSPIAHTKIKHLPESRLYAMDFARVREILDGETLTGTPVVTADAATLTIGSPSISGSQVQFRLSAGTAGTIYTLRCSVETSGGSTIIGEGVLEVIA